MENQSWADSVYSYIPYKLSKASFAATTRDVAAEFTLHNEILILFSEINNVIKELLTIVLLVLKDLLC